MHDNYDALSAIALMLENINKNLEKVSSSLEELSSALNSTLTNDSIGYPNAISVKLENRE